eukprot:TRINITY_DN5924_c0_g1_i1.p1 TRINITY_DN5924_c0_g1~~TRINITY_DN5924_c0_g1_i1.p1  ORF type:complete len:685 (+),score=78.56 TRINITY_DN5924_c0_g1_i1:163-2217(+)
MDLRSVALFRFLLGVTIIADMVNRWSDLTALYSDHGVLPRTIIFPDFTDEYWFSYYYTNGAVWFTNVLFVLHCMVAFLYSIGYKSLYIAPLLWFMTINLFNRNILVLHGGDHLMKQLLFFSIFLPISEIWSYDAYQKSLQDTKHNRKIETPRPWYFGPRGSLRSGRYRFINVGTIAVLCQYILMYVTAYVHKTGKEWTTEGTSAWLALQIDFFRTALGELIIQLPWEILRPLTIATLYLEGYGSVFLVLPIFVGVSRTIGVVLFAGMHLSFGAAMRLGLFGLAPTWGLFLLLPTWFWERVIFRKLRSDNRTRFSLQYWKDSSFCRKVACFSSTFLLIPESEVRPIELPTPPVISQTAEENEDDSPNMNDRKAENQPAIHWLIAQDYKGNISYDFEAILAVLRVSPIAWPFTFLVRWTRRFWQIAFDSLEEQRSEYIKKYEVFPAYPFGSPKGQPLFRVNLLRRIFGVAKSAFWNIFCLSALVYIFGLNATNIHWNDYSPSYNQHVFFAPFNFEQVWSMFSPQPPDFTWYYYMEGELDNGTKVEVWGNEGLFTWEGAPYTATKPVVHRALKNHRWFKYFENGFNSHKKAETLRLYFASYFCREYNERHSEHERMYLMTIYLVTEHVNPEQPYAPRTFDPLVTLHRHKCYYKPGEEPGAAQTQEEIQPVEPEPVAFESEPVANEVL